MRLRIRLISATLLAFFVIVGASEMGAQTVPVSATVETPPVANSGDAADDPAVWIHPTDPSLSTIIGTDKEGALEVYSLAGTLLQRITGIQPNNVDLRYNFLLAGSPVALVTFGNVDNKTIGIYKVNAATRLLENVANGTISPGLSVYGSCMYRSPSSGKYYVFVNAKSGEVRQFELVGNAAGQVSAVQVRAFNVGDQVEGCVADDELGHFYIGEENFGIWKYAAEPSGGSARTLVDGVAAGRLEADVEGLTIYYATGGTGYLIASSQGASEFVIYRREGVNAYVGTFEIVAGNGIDDVSGTDGIDVSNFALGGGFPTGVFVAQDGSNNGNQNFKLVPWERIATAFSPALTIDPSFDPRGGGGGVPGNLPPQVEAGANQTITLPAGANLNGTVSDDGLPDPPASLTIGWSRDSGPGTVSFGTPNLEDTTATFSTAGTHVLRLTAYDGALSASDTINVVVQDAPPPPGSQHLERRVVASADDAEERVSSRSVNLTSSTLNLGSSERAGLRFTALAIPRGATIARAYVQFTSSGSDSSSITLRITGQAADTAAAFAGTTGNISNRVRTTSSVTWSPASWKSGNTLASQQSPDLAAVLSEVTARPGWQSGNALVLVFDITNGSGEREARSFNGAAASAPLLVVDFVNP